MEYTFNNWKNKTGTIPVTWKEHDYTEVSWYQHNGSPGFDSNKQNLDPYKNNIGVLIPRTVPDVFEKVKNYFLLKDLVCDLSKYTPGMLLPWHWDTYPTYSKNMNIDNIENIVRIIVFLHDSQPGHQLWIEDKFCHGPAGSWFSWTGTTKHMAANLGESDRYVIQLTGHV